MEKKVKEPTLSELNSLIKDKVLLLNEAVTIQIKISDAQDQLQRLYAEKTALEDYLIKVEEANQNDVTRYKAIFEKPSAAAAFFRKIYLELNELWPDIHPSQWFIPPPFDTELPKPPRSKFKPSQFTTFLALSYAHRRRSITMKYRFFPEYSRRSATVKLEELRQVAAQIWPSIRDLISEHSILIHEIDKMEQQLLTLHYRVQSQKTLYNSVPEYMHYCTLARAKFIEFRESNEDVLFGSITYPDVHNYLSNEPSAAFKTQSADRHNSGFSRADLLVSQVSATRLRRNIELTMDSTSLIDSQNQQESTMIYHSGRIITPATPNTPVQLSYNVRKL